MMLSPNCTRSSCAKCVCTNGNAAHTKSLSASGPGKALSCVGGLLSSTRECVVQNNNGRDGRHPPTLVRDKNG